MDMLPAGSQVHIHTGLPFNNCFLSRVVEDPCVVHTYPLALLQVGS